MSAAADRLASFGHYLLIAGHRLAPASTLAPFICTQIVWPTALGFLVFGDIPNCWTVAGAVIVIASGLYLLYRERSEHCLGLLRPVHGRSPNERLISGCKGNAPQEQVLCS